MCAAIGDGTNIDWTEQPAIIVDASGAIIDGHHRVAACVLAGVSTYPAIVVPVDCWKPTTMSHADFCKSICEAAEDWVTWGIH